MLKRATPVLKQLAVLRGYYLRRPGRKSFQQSELARCRGCASRSSACGFSQDSFALHPSPKRLGFLAQALQLLG
jgi:hypothetical protein